MKITFVSNYINHHQIPMSEYLYEQLGDGYRFVQTEPMEEERRAMGWGEGTGGRPWVICSYEQPDEVRQLIDESDVVIFGGCEQEELIHRRNWGNFQWWTQIKKHVLSNTVPSFPPRPSDQERTPDLPGRPP